MRHLEAFVPGAVLAAVVATSLFGQAPSPPPSYRFATGSASLNIPVEVVADGLVFVQARVNDYQGWFILDNGTQGFLVDREFARLNSLELTGSGVAHGGGANAIQMQTVHDVQISLPGFDLTHRVLVVIDLKGLEPAIGHTVDGIIGSRLFDDFVVAVDYEHRYFSVSLPGQYVPPAGATPFSVRIDSHGFQYVDATVALPGAEPVAGNFLIDGGSNSYADLYKPFCDAHHLPPPAMKLVEEPGTSTGGKTEAKEGRADRISVGVFSVAHAPVSFAQDVEGLMASKDYSGLIGAEFFERFTVVFDNPDKRIWLTPNGSYAKPVEEDESGLRIHAEGADFHRFVVGRIVPHSPAAEAGIEPGDVLESVDKRSAEEMTLTQLRSLLCQPGASYSLGILRGKEHLRLTVRLRPLY